MSKPQYYLYCRKSTNEADKQILSIEAQKAELREFVIKEQLNIIGNFIESKTAKSRRKLRPIIKNLLYSCLVKTTPNFELILPNLVHQVKKCNLRAS